MRIALVGQPNVGKSTIFNALAGYKAMTANFPGQTVSYTVSSVSFRGQVFEIVDLPGTYSLTSFDKAELEARNYLLSGKADVVVDVLDASALSRGLELTLELADLQLPMLVCLNMMDEARRKGIEINTKRLAALLGVPVVETIANKGKGLEELFAQALEVCRRGVRPRILSFHRDVEEAVAALARELGDEIPARLGVPRRLLSVKLLEGDPFFTAAVARAPGLLEKVRELQEHLERTHGRPADVVISSERHALALNIFEEVARVGEPLGSFQDKVDRFLMDKYLGYPVLLAVLLGLFALVSWFGKLVEPPVTALFDWVTSRFLRLAGEGSLLSFLVKGLADGFSGGVGIVLPYLLPFFLGLGVLEDVGYLPRLAFLTDAFMHRIGLHGNSVLAFVISYGCNVPGVMATRLLRSERDRFVTAFLSSLIPCGARTAVIFGLVAALFGPGAAAAVYLCNGLVVAALGKVLTRFYPEVTPGMILEIPPLRAPSLRVVLSKTWLRLKEFILVAWPLLIASSAFLSFIEYFRLDSYLNLAFTPLTYLLGLPGEVGTTLVFGILRKELSLLMLFQALGTTDVASRMSGLQVLVFTLFVIFYVPCVGTLAALARELGTRRMLGVAFLTLLVAFAVAGAARLLLAPFLS